MPTRLITFDAASHSATTTGTPSSLSWSHTIGEADTDRCLYVGIAMHTTIANVTGITYNGVAMSSIGAQISGISKTVVYALTNPTVGTNTIVASYDAGCHSVGMGVSYYGIDQSSPSSWGGGFGSTGTSASADGQSQGDDLFITFFGKDDTSNAPTVGTGTERAKDLSTFGAGSLNCYGMAAEGTATVGYDSAIATYSWSIGSADWSAYTIAIKPATYLAAQGSIVFEASASGNTGSAGTTTLTFNVTLGSGTKRIGVLTSSEFTASVQSGTFPKYNGSTMTAVGNANVASGVGVKMWYIAVPDGDTGSKAINLQWSSSGRRSATFEVYSGVNQATPIGTPATNSGTTTSASAAPSTSSGQVVVDGLAKRDSTEDATAGTRQTDQNTGQANVTTNATAGNNCWARSSSKDANDGTTTMQWSWNVGRQWAFIAVGLLPDTFLPKMLPEQLGLHPMTGLF